MTRETGMRSSSRPVTSLATMSATPSATGTRLATPSDRERDQRDDSEPEERQPPPEATSQTQFDVLSYLIPRYFGRLSFGKIYGIAFAAYQLASAIAAYAVSVSRESYGSYIPAMLVLAALCVICAALFLNLGPYRYDAAHEQPRRRSDVRSN